MIRGDMNRVLPIFLVSCIGTCAAAVVRNTTLGAVFGNKLTILNTTVEEYIGIPYAEPPLGDLRFMPPRPKEPWQGTYIASHLRTGCPQRVIPGALAGTVTYAEDCLHLNVWTSQLQSADQHKSEELRPVLVWIPGGGFSYGSAAHDNYTGSILAAKTGFVVFSVNYRLGALGFLDASTSGAPGNMGLMDQNLALRWIKDNARFFGGDPAKVTLFGESAGALSIHCHVLSPMSRGLFTRAVLLSGSMYSIDVYDSPEESIEKANLLAQKVGCTKAEGNLTTHPQEVLNCLRKLPADEIVTASLAVVAPKIFPFFPTYHNQFLPKDPRWAVDRGLFNQVDMIVGVTSDEMSVILVHPPIYDFLQENLDGIEPARINGLLQSVAAAWLKSSLPESLEHYLTSNKDASNVALVRQYIDYLSDRGFNCPVSYLERKHSSGGNKVFAYVFDHKYHSPALPSWMGTPHAGELVFLFGFPLVTEKDAGDENQALSATLIKILESFAMTGRPELPGKKTWPEYSEQNPVSVVLAPGNFTELRDFRGRECEYWKKHLQLGG